MTETKDATPSMAELDLPLMANAYDIRARHYMLHLNLDEEGWKQQTFEGQVIIFLESLNTKDENEPVLIDQECNSNDDPDFQCILDCCDIHFHGVYEVILPDPYKNRFCRSKADLLTFDERKDLETMQNFYR